MQRKAAGEVRGDDCARKAPGELREEEEARFAVAHRPTLSEQGKQGSEDGVGNTNEHKNCVDDQKEALHPRSGTAMLRTVLFGGAVDSRTTSSGSTSTA